MNKEIFIKRGYYLPIIFLLLSIIGSCNNDIPGESHSVIQPDPNRPSSLESFSPNKGGVGTKLVLKGVNLGSDTSCLKVYVNDKKATIIGANNDFVYAVIAARSTGEEGSVKLEVRKGEKNEILTAKEKFDYQLKQNVTTVLGKKGDNNRIDGPLQTARIKGPWNIIRDKDDVVYILEEGAGTSGEGALRRIKDGEIETVMQNSPGPMQHPASMAWSPNEDTLYVTNYNRGEVKLFCLTRSMGFMDPKALVSYPGAGDAANACVGVATHPVTGDVFFFNQNKGTICKWIKGQAPESAWEAIGTIGNEGRAEAYMRFHNDWLYMVCMSRHCIYRAKYNPATRELSPAEYYAGKPGERGDSDVSVYEGPKENVRFADPGLPDWDSDGNMYVPNRYGYVIQKIDTNGNVTLVTRYGRIHGGDLKDGDPVEARFDGPSSLVILSDQSIYVTDQYNNAIRKIVVE